MTNDGRYWPHDDEDQYTGEWPKLKGLLDAKRFAAHVAARLGNVFCIGQFEQSGRSNSIYFTVQFDCADGAEESLRCLLSDHLARGHFKSFPPEAIYSDMPQSQEYDRGEWRDIEGVSWNDEARWDEAAEEIARTMARIEAETKESEKP